MESHVTRLSAEQRAAARQARLVATLGPLARSYLDRVVGAGLPMPELEVIFARPRLWRLDFFWADRQIAVEVDGGVFGRGLSRHTTGSGYTTDAEKTNEAAIRGILLLKFTPPMIRDGRALMQTQRAFQARTPGSTR